MLKAALIQMCSACGSGESFAHNWQVAESLVAKAAESGAKLIVLPENFLSFASKERATIEQQKLWVKQLSQLAAKLRIKSPMPAALSLIIPGT